MADVVWSCGYCAENFRTLIALETHQRYLHSDLLQNILKKEVVKTKGNKEERIYRRLYCSYKDEQVSMIDADKDTYCRGYALDPQVVVKVIKSRKCCANCDKLKYIEHVSDYRLEQSTEEDEIDESEV